MINEIDVFEYLDDLREDGAINMFGARPFIESQFKVSKQEANQLLSKWMKTFGERHE